MPSGVPFPIVLLAYLSGCCGLPQPWGASLVFYFMVPSLLLNLGPIVTLTIYEDIRSMLHAIRSRK